MFQVKKKSGKPFKSGKKVNSVKGIVTNENDPQKRNAYIFYDDDSVVNIDICEIITKNK
jgi:hypothetical protein